ncbi:MAG: hypothetical protein GY698_06380 [Actinomycetia bacterium]|nr:hypothetical protein [Actinomycetes bacterium]
MIGGTEYRHALSFEVGFRPEQGFQGVDLEGERWIQSCISRSFIGPGQPGTSENAKDDPSFMWRKMWK